MLTGYQVENADPADDHPESSVSDVAVTVQTDLSLEIEKVDEPDGVAPRRRR